MLHIKLLQFSPLKESIENALEFSSQSDFIVLATAMQKLLLFY